MYITEYRNLFHELISAITKLGNISRLPAAFLQLDLYIKILNCLVIEGIFVGCVMFSFIYFRYVFLKFW